MFWCIWDIISSEHLKNIICIYQPFKCWSLYGTFYRICKLLFCALFLVLLQHKFIVHIIIVLCTNILQGWFTGRHWYNTMILCLLQWCNSEGYEVKSVHVNFWQKTTNSKSCAYFRGCTMCYSEWTKLKLVDPPLTQSPSTQLAVTGNNDNICKHHHIGYLHRVTTHWTAQFVARYDLIILTAMLTHIMHLSHESRAFPGTRFVEK